LRHHVQELDVRARGEVEDLVVETVGNSRTDAGALRLAPDLRRRTAERLVAVTTLALTDVRVVRVFLGIAVV